jgi:hypothetical protein
MDGLGVEVYHAERWIGTRADGADPGAVAASSVVVYDIIGTYIRPLTGKQVVYWSHILIGKSNLRFRNISVCPDGREGLSSAFPFFRSPVALVRGIRGFESLS